MVQPLNYQMDVVNPLQMALQGYQAGQRERLANQQMELAAQEAARAEAAFPMQQQALQQRMDLAQSQEQRAGQQFGMQQQEFAQQQQARQQQLARQQAMQKAVSDLAANPGATAEDYSRIMTEYPEVANQLNDGFQNMDKAQKESAFREMGQIYAAVDSGNVEVAKKLLNDRIAAANNSGMKEDAQEAEAMLAALEFDPTAAKTSIGLTLKALGGADADKILTGGKSTVRSTEKLADGTVITVTDQGPIVYGPDGQRLKGQAAADAVKAGQEYETQLKREREFSKAEGRLSATVDLGGAAEKAKALGKFTGKLVQDAFQGINKVKSNISNLDRAYELVTKEGANTGWLASKFPSWKASTLELQQLKNTLGIDVINSATFGALSKPELELALDTGMDMKMSPPELADWLQRKKVAQEKLLNNLQMQSTFFEAPNGTPSKWIEFEQTGISTVPEMKQWMQENMGSGGSQQQSQAQPAQSQPQAESPQMAFVKQMQQLIQSGQKPTPEQVARLRQIQQGGG